MDSGASSREELRQIGLVDDPVRVSEHAQARERTEHAADCVRVGTCRDRQLLCGPRSLVNEVGDSQPGDGGERLRDDEAAQEDEHALALRVTHASCASIVTESSSSETRWKP